MKALPANFSSRILGRGGKERRISRNRFLEFKGVRRAMRFDVF